MSGVWFLIMLVALAAWAFWLPRRKDQSERSLNVSACWIVIFGLVTLAICLTIDIRGHA